jgi:hypothetical protein
VLYEAVKAHPVSSQAWADEIFNSFTSSYERMETMVNLNTKRTTLLQAILHAKRALLLATI